MKYFDLKFIGKGQRHSIIRVAEATKAIELMLDADVRNVAVFIGRMLFKVSGSSTCSNSAIFAFFLHILLPFHSQFDSALYCVVEAFHLVRWKISELVQEYTVSSGFYTYFSAIRLSLTPVDPFYSVSNFDEWRG